MTSISQAARLIHKEAGLRAFFRGNLVNCLKIAPENATKFVCYDFAKDHLVADKNSMNAMERFLCGALAVTTCFVSSLFLVSFLWIREFAAQWQYIRW